MKPAAMNAFAFRAAWIRFVAVLATLFASLWSTFAFAQAAEVTGSVDENEVELGDTVTYTLQATSTTSDSPNDPTLSAPQGFTVVDSRRAPSHSVSWINGRTSEKHSLTATWTLRSDRLGTFTIGPATVTIAGAKKTSPAARVTVVAPGQGKPKARRPAQQQRPFDPWASPFDPFKGLFPQQQQDDDFADPLGGIGTDPKLSLDRERGQGAFLHATVDKTRAVIGEQVTLNVYLYEDIHGRGINPTDVHEATATDFVKRSLLQDESKAVNVGYASAGGRTWAVRLIRKSALFPLKTGRLDIRPMTLTLANTRNGLRESESLFVDVSEPPIANRPAGYQVGDTGEFSLSSTTSPKSIDQHGALGVTVELRGTGNFPASLPTPEISGVEWLEPQTRDSLGPVANDRFGGTRTFSYVVRIHNAGSIDLGEVRLPYFDPQTRSYKVARTSLGIVTVAKAEGRDAGADVTDPVLGNLPAPRAALEGKHEETFWTERPLFWVLLFGAPVACALALAMSSALGRIREQRRAAAPSPERVARDRRAEAEAALAKDDGKAAVAAIGRALEAEILASTGVNVRGTSTDGAANELVDAGVHETTAKNVTRVLAECDNARFAPEGVSIETARSLWKRARDAAAAAKSGTESVPSSTGGVG